MNSFPFKLEWRIWSWVDDQYLNKEHGHFYHLWLLCFACGMFLLCSFCQHPNAFNCQIRWSKDFFRLGCKVHPWFLWQTADLLCVTVVTISCQLGSGSSGSSEVNILKWLPIFFLLHSLSSSVRSVQILPHGLYCALRDNTWIVALFFFLINFSHSSFKYLSIQSKMY